MPQYNGALPMVRSAVALASAAGDESRDHGGDGGGGGEGATWVQVGAAWMAQNPIYPAHVQEPVDGQRQHWELPHVLHLIQEPSWHPQACPSSRPCAASESSLDGVVCRGELPVPREW